MTGFQWDADGAEDKFLKGGTDGQRVGNVGDRLLVDIGSTSTIPVPVALPLITDMTNRLKVARTKRIFSSSWQYNKQPRTWTERITGSCSISSAGQKDPTYLKLTTGTASGNLVEFGTKRFIKYRPFRTHELTAALVFGAGDANLVQRFGQFTGFNGWFFERQGNDLCVVIRNNTNEQTGTNETKIERANWNHDKFDGTGPSGIDLASNGNLSGADGAMTNAFTYIIEYAWHGTQGIKFGIQYFDKLYWGHFYKFSGTNDIPFARTALLPLRVESENVGTLSASQDWYLGPVSFNIEDGEEIFGEQLTVNTGTANISVASSTVPTNLLAIRPKLTINGSNNRGFLVPKDFKMFTTDDLLVDFVILADVTATWTDVSSESITQYAVGSDITAVTGGYVVDSSYISGGGNTTAQVTTTVESNLFASIDALNNNTPLCILIRARKLGGNASAYAAMDFREVF